MKPFERKDYSKLHSYIGFCQLLTTTKKNQPTAPKLKIVCHFQGLVALHCTALHLYCNALHCVVQCVKVQAFAVQLSKYQYFHMHCNTVCCSAVQMFTESCLRLKFYPHFHLSKYISSVPHEYKSLILCININHHEKNTAFTNIFLLKLTKTSLN